MKLTAQFGDRQAEYATKFIPRDVNLTVPTGMYARVLHDWELAEFDYKPRQMVAGYKKIPVPSTRMMWGRNPADGRIYDFIPFPKEWQFWLWDLLKYTLDNRAPVGKIEYFYNEGEPDIPVAPHPYAFAKCTEGSLTWAYVNLIQDHRSFTDTQAPENGRADYVTGRNLSAKPHSWKCLTTTGNIVKIIGSDGIYYKIEALDVTKPPPPVESVMGTHLIHWATEQSLVQIGARWVVARYPQL
jgi:hypothetical protein